MPQVGSCFRTQLHAASRTAFSAGWRETGPDHYAHAANYCDAAGIRVRRAAAKLQIFGV